jgi:predicted aspartyl protease
VRRRVDPSLILDTGATYTALPRGVADALGIESVGIRRIKLASGREEEWPVGVILLELEDQRLATICLLSPEFALGVDPTARRLVPVTGYLMAMAR